MNCLVYCTASSYFIKPLYQFLKSRYNTTLYRDLIHIEIPINGEHADGFFFSHGTAIFWNVSVEQCGELLSSIQDFEDQPLREKEKDHYTYDYGETLKVSEERLLLPNQKILTKLAISHGLAQSAKLATFETAIQESFNKTKRLPEYLSTHGRIPLSKREIRKKIGELFIERNSINLHVNVLDVPEFFWESPEYEPLYTNITTYLDIESRVEVLNQRLAVVHELLEMLATELNHKQSCRLEWAIIILIVTEVALTLFRDVFHIL